MMASYTLSNCILNNIELDKKYITDVLMVFTQQSNPFKVALDKGDKILGLYETVAQKNEFAAYWLSLMSMKPSSFESIDIETNDDVNEEEIFLKVCSSTKSQQKLIVMSHESWQYYRYDSPKVITYNNIPVRVFDRDEAISELNPTNSTTSIMATNSTVAIDGSIIEDSKNINK
jgi:hypothetical protein